MGLDENLDGKNARINSCVSALKCSESCKIFSKCIEELLESEKSVFFDIFLHKNSLFRGIDLDKNISFIEKFVNKETFYKELISYIREKFISNDGFKLLPNSISDFIQEDENFKKLVIEEVNFSLENILEDFSINSFEELNLLLYLLGCSKKQNLSISVFSDNESSFVEIEEFLSYYDEKKIIEASFENFELLMSIFELLNKIILFGFTFSNNSKNIANLFKISINKLSFILNILESSLTENHENIKYAKKIRGVYKIMFSNNFHIIDFSNSCLYFDIYKEPNILLDLSLKIFNDYISGYEEIKESNYGNGTRNKKGVELAFIGNVSKTLLELFGYLSNYSDFKYYSFVEIIKNYQKYINKDFVFRDLESFKYDIYKQLFKVYGLSTSVSDSLNDYKKHESVKGIISDFIANPDLNDQVIESVADLLKFSVEQIDISDLLFLGNHFLSFENKNGSDRFQSDYYEKFKIDILITILSKIREFGVDDKSNNFVILLEEYVTKNKIASNLLYHYTEIYLYLSLYYSDKKQYQDKAEEFFYKFNQIYQVNNNENNFKKYEDICLKIAFNLGKTIQNKLVESKNKFSENLTLNIERIGIYKLFFLEEIYKLKTQTKLSSEIFTILNDINSSGENGFSQKIFSIISKELFFGICEISLISQNNLPERKKGYLYKRLELSRDYSLCFKYPEIYDEEFNNIFSREKSVLENQIGIIITEYELRKDLEIDRVSGFYNEAKLRQDLGLITKKSNFAIMRFENVSNINMAFSPEIGDRYIYAISKLLKKIFLDYGVKFYKISGTSFVIELMDGKLDQEQIFSLFELVKSGELDLGTIKKFDNLQNLSFKVSEAKFGLVLDEKEEIFKKLLLTLGVLKDDKILYTSELETSEHKENIEILSMVQEAIDEDRVEPFFQAIIDLETGETYKYETLVRIRDRNGDFIPPYKFVPNVKRAGRTYDIAAVMIDKTFKFLSKNRDKKISINLYGNDFLNENILHLIDEKIFQYHLEDLRDHITFEILEDEFPKDKNIIEDVCDSIKKIKNKGFKISLDDFGSESQNFDRLSYFISKGLLDYVKIDGNIIKYIKEGFMYDSISGLVKACNDKKIKVIAEFVEDEKIVKILKELGVNYGQGYHFSEPIQEKDMYQKLNYKKKRELKFVKMIDPEVFKKKRKLKFVKMIDKDILE